jgi:hypothetical protein
VPIQALLEITNETVGRDIHVKIQNKLENQSVFCCFSLFIYQLEIVVFDSRSD